MDDATLRTIYLNYIDYCNEAEPGVEPLYNDFEEFKDWWLSLPESLQHSTAERYRKGHKRCIAEGIEELRRARG